MEKIKLNIKGLSYSKNPTGAYALILSEVGTERQLAIVIGKNEAKSIAIYLEGIATNRPLSHDLMKTIIDSLQAKIIKVDIVKLEDGIFYAEIHLTREKHSFRLDARVSDAIALSVRFGASIYTTESIMNRASFIPEINDSEVPEEVANNRMFQEYNLKQLEMLIEEAIREENYERAGELKKEIERRKQKE